MATAVALCSLLAACGGKAVIDGTASGEAGMGGADGGQGGGQLTINLSNVMVSIGCKPGLDLPDPVDVSFTATYDNGGPASATANTIIATVLLGEPPNTLYWGFQVSPTAVGPVPGNSSVQVDHAMVEGSGSGGDLPCGFCTSPSTLLEVDYLIDGQDSVVVAGSGSLYCSK